jgi:hypothetical protein
MSPKSTKTLAILSGIILTIAGAITAQPAATPAQRIDKLEVGVERAEALRAIKRLQYTHTAYLDAGLWNDLAELYTANAVAERIMASEVADKATGKAAIRNYWMKLAARTAPGLADGQLNTHLMMQPIVNLGEDGRTAKGTWHELAMTGGTAGGPPTWTGTIYENDYVMQDGTWKISGVHRYQQYSGTYEEPGQKGTMWKVPFHFTGDHVGVTIPASALTTPAPSSKTAPAAHLANLTARLERMSDENAVSNLQHSYGYYMDRHHWDDVADLFTEDGTWESGQRGVYAGKAQIRKALETFYGAPALRFGELFDHLTLGTIVTISPDGRTAAARTTELVQLGLNQEYARWELGAYEDEFVKQDGTWKIKSIHYYPRMITDYEKGWGKEGKPAPGVSTEFTPGKKPTAAYEIYPKFSFPAFHFANPVTGKAAAYPAGVIKSVISIATKAPQAKPAAKTLAETETALAAAELELARAIGVDATENLMSSYGYYLDEGLWDDMANTFGLQGSKEITGAGVYAGSEKIRAILKARGAQGVGRSTTSFTIHQLIQPVIHVSADGKKANARLRLFQGGGRMDGTSATWIGGTYENTAFFENGEWKFGRQDLHHHFNASYRNGWAKFAAQGAPAAQAPKPAATKGPAPAAPKARPIVSLTDQIAPDWPIRARQYTFPVIDEPAFHYKNPVSGRAPKELLP